MQIEEVISRVVPTNQDDRSGFDDKTALFKSCEMRQTGGPDQGVIMKGEEVNDSHVNSNIQTTI